MKGPSEITGAGFERLLGELAPDRESAGQEYEALRARLIKLFQCRCCARPDELADRTLDRLARRLAGGLVVENVYGYCCGIARIVALEARREQQHEGAAMAQLRLQAVTIRSDSAISAALSSCLKALPARSRNLVLRYYEDQKSAKIERRKRLAAALGIPITALRLRAFRVRAWLEDCVNQTVAGRNHSRIPDTEE